MDNTKLAKAKSALILDQPFFASLLLAMPISEDTSIPTMATDGESIKVNPSFLESMTLSETIFVLAHETLHCVFMHMYRRGARNHNKWNIAADYVINDLLVNERIGTMLKGGLYDAALVKRAGNTSEGVYALLPESDEKKAPGNKGGSLDDCMDAGKDDADKAAKEAEMRVKIAQAANAAKMSGKLSQGLQRLIGDVTKPKTDWKDILRRFFTERAKVDFSYSKPKRRFLADDIYLPSLTGERLGTIVVAIDCSGSISEDVLNRFGAEIKAIVEDTSPLSVHIIYFDSQVLKTETFECGEAISLNAMGGGGTAFSPIFKRIDTENLNPVACVVLTDLCCSDFGTQPSYPVMWASTESGNAPFGETIIIKE